MFKDKIDSSVPIPSSCEHLDLSEIREGSILHGVNSQTNVNLHDSNKLILTRVHDDAKFSTNYNFSLLLSSQLDKGTQCCSGGASSTQSSQKHRDLSFSALEPLTGSTMGGHSKAVSKVISSLVEEDINQIPDPTLLKTMEELTQRTEMSERSFNNDHRDNVNDCDNHSTCSTIDSHLFHALSGQNSPTLNPMHGELYEEHHIDNDVLGRVLSMTSASHLNENMSSMPVPQNSTEVQLLTNNRVTMDRSVVPSTACSVSTASSTADEASSLGLDSAAYQEYFRQKHELTSAIGSPSGSVTQYNGMNSPWDGVSRQQQFNSPNTQIPTNGISFDHSGFPPLHPQHILQPHLTQHQHGAAAWVSQVVRGNQQQVLHQPQTHHMLPIPQRVASFRGSHEPQNTGFHNVTTTSSQRHHHQVNQQHAWPSSHMNPPQSYLHHPQSPRKSNAYGIAMLPAQSTSGTNVRGHNRTDSSGGQSSSSSVKNMNALKLNSPQRMPPSTHQSQNLSISASNQGVNNSRSPSEVLKTLLRRKACLYEPETSRAVALVTWLVGRELALEYGYFSRQQLQAGVHSCVTSKIDAGIITRTKVNRCMQIILNSCFHYIIPRPDGTEENGEGFRSIFAKDIEVALNSNDAEDLLMALPAPWRDIYVNREEIIHACSHVDETNSCGLKKDCFEEPVTPSHSPRLGAIASEKGSPLKDGDQTEGDHGDGKRAVLLCFNENVRRAEDVFRCHNEFIRDTAHASNLQLSSSEWQIFFGKEAAESPNLWGNIGIPVPYLEGQGPAQTDALGVFNKRELDCFRTTWCSKRYDHNHLLCGFAHAEINFGWLKRNPSDYIYRDELCPFITRVDKYGSNSSFWLNECPKGIDCEYAHSLEEINYHPGRYKCKKVCSSTVGRQGGCFLGDVCPNFHPKDSYRFPKKSDNRSPRHSRQTHSSMHIKGTGTLSSSHSSSIPSASPMLYASPAPISNFEHHLIMPGLQQLFRRHCSVLRAHVRGETSKTTCYYSHFGDDDGITYSTLPSK